MTGIAEVSGIISDAPTMINGVFASFADAIRISFKEMDDILSLKRSPQTFFLPFHLNA